MVDASKRLGLTIDIVDVTQIYFRLRLLVPTHDKNAIIQEIRMNNDSKQKVLDRVLQEVRSAEKSGASAATTEHSVYVSGLFEKEAESDVLNRVLAEVRAAESSNASAVTTEHSVYVSGLFDRD